MNLQNLFFIPLLLSFSGFSQQILWNEDFETSENLSYTVSNTFNDGCNDHFSRTDGTNVCLNTCSGNDFYSGFQGNFFFAGEDLDDSGGGGDEIDEKVLLFPEIDVSEYTNLTFSGLFGAGNNCDVGANNYDDVDYLRAYYINNTSDTVLFLAFESLSNSGDETNEPLAEDVDLDGIGDGVVLNQDLALFSKQIPDMNKVRLFIIVHLDSDKEEIAFDALQITGQYCKKPEITAINRTSNSTCPGETVSITVEGELGSANKWEWFSDSCNGEKLGEGAQIEVNPLITSTYYVRGTGNCVINSLCEEKIVIKEDINPPTIIAPEEIELPINRDCNVLIPNLISQVFAEDNCSQSLVVKQVPEPGSILPDDTNEILFKVKDNNDNISEARSFLKLTDSIKPVIEGNTNFNLYTNSECEYLIPDLSGKFTITDNCSILNIEQSPPPNTEFTKGITNGMLSVTDNFGNLSEFEFKINLIDTLAPKFTGPDTIFVFKDSDCISKIGDYASLLSVEADCDVLSIKQFPEVGSESSEEISQVSFEIADDWGNTSRTTSVLIAKDTLKPYFTKFPHLLELELIDCKATVPDIEFLLSYEDNCTSELTLTQNIEENYIIENDTTMQVLIVDKEGNQEEIEIQLQLIDRFPPVLDCPEVVQVPSHLPINDLTHLVKFTDECEREISISQQPLPGNAPTDIDKITFTVSDRYENYSTCSVDIDIITEVEKDAVSAIKIYPNPFDNDVFIKNASYYDIKIHTLDGTLIYDKFIRSDEFHINSNKFPLGSLIMSVYSENSIISQWHLIKRK